jgi:hypothetical protein
MRLDPAGFQKKGHINYDLCFPRQTKRQRFNGKNSEISCLNKVFGDISHNRYLM